jgi:hypothetical protein
VLRPFREVALQGGDFLYGHTVLQRALGLGYQSAWAKRSLPTRRARNAFYIAVGAQVQPGEGSVARVAALDPSRGPDALLAQLHGT